MERIKTKIIIAVAEALRNAKDTDAKTDLIEELSENLYQRYCDLTASGVSEEEAYSKAMEDLGDVSELLAYLNDMESGEAQPGGENSGNHFNVNDFFKGMEDVVRETLTQAKDAVDQAKIITRDLERKFKEKYPEDIQINCGFDKSKGGFFWESNRKGRTIAETTIPAESVKALDIQLNNGDVDIYVAEQENVVVSGDAEDLEVSMSDDGILYVRQGKTASSSAVFGRGLARTDVELTLPEKVWESIRINTVNGDITFNDAQAMEVREISIETTSGDVTIDDVCCPQLTIRSISGDISGEELVGNVYADSKSGDITLAGSFAEVKASSMSGDVEFTGTAGIVNCSSMSGDVNVDTDELPREMDVSSKSGDCCACIPGGEGFTVNLHTVSGDLNTDFELVGIIGRKSGSAVYLDGGDRTFRISSVSGDVSLEKK